MGTLARIVVDTPDRGGAAAAMKAAFARIREIEGRLSDYDEGSESRRLEHAPRGVPVPVSNDLHRVLEHALQVSFQTEGAFDVTLGEATRAWRAGQPAAPRNRYREVTLGPGAVVLHGEAIGFDFGGIAKGYAADEALRVLRQRGFPRALVAISGDLAIGDAPAGKPGWRIGLGAADRVEFLAGCGVSTSGDRYQARRGGSHILDARAGEPRPARPGSVTVIARSAMEADALATAIHVMGKEQAEKRLLPREYVRVIFGDR